MSNIKTAQAAMDYLKSHMIVRKIQDTAVNFQDVVTADFLDGEITFTELVDETGKCTELIGFRWIGPVEAPHTIKDCASFIPVHEVSIERLTHIINEYKKGS